MTSGTALAKRRWSYGDTSASCRLEQREAVERRVLDESSYAVMAKQIGCSQQVVRKRVSRGLAALRERIEETT